MATKRMFSLNVIDTDNFLEMPMSARLLYYDLGMRADDDGFVGNCKKILLFTGAKEDDLKILITKGYVIPFENGVIVIRHWKMNNYLQNDRTKPTIYQQELKQLHLDNSGVYNLYTNCIHSIEENSIDKISIEENRSNTVPVEKNEESKKAKTEERLFETEFDKLWNIYPNKVGETYAKESYLTARNNGTSYEEIETGLKGYIDHIKSYNIEARYVKQGGNWFKEQCWKNEYRVSSKTSSEPKWFKTEIKRNEATLEEQNELEELIKGVSNNE